MTTKHLSTKNSTAQFEYTFTASEVDEKKIIAVDELIKNVTVKGFREGKAPRAIAEKHLDPDKLTNTLLNHLLSSAIKSTLDEHKLHLFGRPVLEKMDTKDKDNWVVVISFPLYPEIKLIDYKKTFAGTSKSKSADAKTNREEQTNRLNEELLKLHKVDVSQVIIDEEVAHSMHRLEHQAENLNLTLDQYLQAVKKTKEELTKEFSESAVKNISLDLIYAEIAKAENITVTQEELEKTGLDAQYYPQLTQVLSRQKSIDFLLAL